MHASDVAWCARSSQVCGSVQVRKNVKGLHSFQQSAVDPDTVPYADAAREKARRKELRKQAAAGKVASDGSGRQPSSCKARKKQQQVQQRAEKAKQQQQQQQQQQHSKKMPAAKRQLQQSREDMDDLQDDYRLYRKHKKGKVQDDEYMRSIGLLE